MITSSDLWIVDPQSPNTFWSRHLAGYDYPEHHWFNNSCASCSGCTYKGCNVHETCDCTGGLDA